MSAHNSNTNNTSYTSVIHLFQKDFIDICYHIWQESSYIDRFCVNVRLVKYIQERIHILFISTTSSVCPVHRTQNQTNQIKSYVMSIVLCKIAFQERPGV